MKTYYTERRIQFQETSISSALSEITDVLATHNEEDCVAVHIDPHSEERDLAGNIVLRVFQVEMILQKEERSEG